MSRQLYDWRSKEIYAPTVSYSPVPTPGMDLRPRLVYLQLLGVVGSEGAVEDRAVCVSCVGTNRVYIFASSLWP